MDSVTAWIQGKEYTKPLEDMEAPEKELKKIDKEVDNLLKDWDNFDNINFNNL